MDDSWQVYDITLQSRLFLGTAQYPSPAIMHAAIEASGAQVITTSLRRQAPTSGGGETWWKQLRELGHHVLPNTAGCTNAKEAVTLAQMARELFQTNWIKLEITGDDYNLQPNIFELMVATEQLHNLGFKVFAYTTEDLVVCKRLRDLGCQVIMPWGAPIGTGKGLLNPYALQTLRARLPDVRLVVDAGIGLPSHVAQAMELGLDGVLLNTSIARCDDPVLMAKAMHHAVVAGRLAYLAGTISERETAIASTPIVGTPFWQSNQS